MVLVRHGKSDWSGAHADRDRPLAARGRRQAPESGRWLAANGPRLDLAVVSPALRAARTWELVAAELDEPPPVSLDERAYTFDGDALLDVLRELPDDVHAVALVGHNPALEDLLDALTGDALPMPTSCLAVVSWDGPWAAAGDGAARLAAHGRPPA